MAVLREAERTPVLKEEVLLLQPNPQVGVVFDRGASIRMPVNFVKNGYKGYLEDRRPNSEGDPYQIVSRILKTINSVPKPESGPMELRRAS